MAFPIAANFSSRLSRYKALLIVFGSLSSCRFRLLGAAANNPPFCVAKQSSPRVRGGAPASLCDAEGARTQAA